MSLEVHITNAVKHDCLFAVTGKMGPITDRSKCVASDFDKEKKPLLR